MIKKYPVLFASGVTFVIFLIFSYLVRAGAYVSADLRSTTVLQNHISRVFDAPFSLFSLLGSVEVTGIILVLSLYFLLKGKFREQMLALVLFGFGSAIEVVGKYLLYHPSPPFGLYRGIGFVFPSKYIHTNFSYPSGHIFRTTFILILVLLLLKNKNKPLVWAAAAVILVFMAVSRVYLGEHWTTDVVGGALLGATLALLSAYLIKKAKI